MSLREYEIVINSVADPTRILKLRDDNGVPAWAGWRK